MSKLNFHVVSFSSEDSGFPAEELNVHGPDTKGWQSVKFSTYPQEIGLEMEHGIEAKISKIQVLSHQSKIASKVEVLIGKGSSYETATFKRLGFLTLDNNERSGYRARELKTVYLDKVGTFVKLLVHQNHVNNINIYNQVGIIAINLMGTIEAPGKIRNDAIGRPQHIPSSSILNDLSVEMNLDPQTAVKIRQLAEAKTRAVAAEDYVAAKQIKGVESEIKELGTKLAQIDFMKRQAVEAEEYDRAKDLKDEGDGLRREIERRVRTIQIPGIADSRQLPKQHQSPMSEDPRMPLSGRGRGSPVPGPTFAGGYTNVDDIPVGPGVSSAEAKDYSGSSASYGGKKVAKEEPMEFDDDGGSFSRFDPSNNDLLPNGDRAIRPKAKLNYNDPDPMIGEVAQPDTLEQFPPGQHPLEGVEGLAELPNPEELYGKSKEVADQAGITLLLGDYIARCLFSKTWALREAALTKVQSLLVGRQFEMPKSLTALVAVVRVGVDDKMQQVLFAAVSLLDEVLVASRHAAVGRGTLAPMLDHVIGGLIEKLADSNARIRDGAQKGIECICASTNVGPSVISFHALKALQPKLQSNWRVIVARLKLISDLIEKYGVGGSTGLATDTCMNYIKSVGGFTHGNGQVRDVAKQLTVNLQRIVGTPALEPFLKDLRQQQIKEYYLAFSAVDSKPGDGPSGVGGGDHHTSPRQQHQQSKPHNHHAQSAGGKVNNAAMRAQERMSHDEAHASGEPQDFTTCMFCGTSDRGWNEDALDLHYWKDCPLLAPCPACAQVVETAGLPEHLLDECEHKALYTPCDITGLAIRSQDFEAWRKSGKCKSPPESCIYCPLCLSTVEDSDEAWKKHLMQGCPQNSRTQQQQHS